jgi:hypothetical protein
MHNAEPDNPFRIFTYRSKLRTVRFLVSPRVVERIPFIEELLMRAAAGGGTSDELIWPNSLIVSGEGESLSIPADNLHVVLPNWLFDEINEQQKRKLHFLLRMMGDVTSREIYWSFAWVLSLYLAPLQKDDDLRKNCHILINVGLFFPIEYRPIRTNVGALLMLPVLLVFFVVIYGGSAVWRNNRKLLYIKADLEWNLGRRRALAKTRQRLFDLGEPADKLKKFVFTPQLKIVESETQQDESN